MSKNCEESESPECTECLVSMRRVGVGLERCENPAELVRLSEVLKKMSWVAHCLGRHREWTVAGRQREARAARNLIALYLTELPATVRWR